MVSKLTRYFCNWWSSHSLSAGGDVKQITTKNHISDMIKVLFVVSFDFLVKKLSYWLLWRDGYLNYVDACNMVYKLACIYMTQSLIKISPSPSGRVKLLLVCVVIWSIWSIWKTTMIFVRLEEHQPRIWCFGHYETMSLLFCGLSCCNLLLGRSFTVLWCKDPLVLFFFFSFF